MTIPIYLTLVRLVLTPLFVFLYLYPCFFGVSQIFLPYLLLGIVAISEVTDFLDGAIARRFNLVTDLGKVLDPAADSIFKISAFLAFTQGAVSIPLPIVLIFFIRDSLISTLRVLCAHKGKVLAARKSGKIKAAIQAAVLFLILFLMILQTRGDISLELFQTISMYSTLIASLYALISGAEYILHSKEAIKASSVCETISQR